MLTIIQTSFAGKYAVTSYKTLFQNQNGKTLKTTVPVLFGPFSKTARRQSALLTPFSVDLNHSAFSKLKTLHIKLIGSSS